MEFLTDSLSDGRAFGTGGAQRTAFYIFRQFRNAGLRTSFQSFEANGKVGHNVIGVTPGWYSKYIVVGAYFDGLGRLNGVLYPGADSNASGVAALLSLSRNLGSFCDGDTGLIFVAFDAHHAGMNGSREFLEWVSMRYDISLMVNLDTIGSTLEPLRKNRPEYLIALGGESWHFAMLNANRGFGLDLNYNYYGSANFTELFYRRISDQRWFLEAGIPAVMFTSGITDYTNKSGDSISNINFPVLEKRIAVIGRWIMNLL